MSKSNRARGTKKTVGYGFVGRWMDGTLGWWLPNHISGMPRERAEPYNPCLDDLYNKPENLVLCKITVEQVFGKNGRVIGRKSKGKGNSKSA